MMKSRKTWWLIFSAAVLTIAAALSWVSALVLQLEHNELAARTDAEYQESLRLALWRMDSWLAPQLARESARPYFEYQPFYEPQRIYSSSNAQLDRKGFLTVSPLLNYSNDLFPLHFQFDENGIASSPQVPPKQFDELADNENLKKESVSNKQLLLDEVDILLTNEVAKNQVTLGEQRLNQPQIDGDSIEEDLAAQSSIEQNDVQIRKGSREAGARRQNANLAQQSIPQQGMFAQIEEDANASEIEIGALVPV